jgi:hypothetical protein
VDTVTVCAVTVDFGLDVSVSSSFVDDVDEAVLAVPPSDAASSSSSSSSLEADDEPFVPGESDDGAELVPAESEFDEFDVEDDDEDPEDSEELD